jgi:hypothetical protein
MSQAFTGEPSVGSPMKKQRANDEEAPKDRSVNFPSALGDVLGRFNNDQKKADESRPKPKEEEEEL